MENQNNDTNVVNFEKDDYYQKTAKLLHEKYKSKQVLAFVKSYGCQQNFSDGEKLSGTLQNIGCEITNSPKEADIIVINTCAIREHAEKKIFSGIGEFKALKKAKPDLIIAICGCMGEEKDAVDIIKRSYPFVDLVCGTNLIHKFPEMIFEILSKQNKIFKIGSQDYAIYEDLPIKRSNKIKSFVPVMYGCDNFCSYCIVPYVRGRERSREPKKIISECKNLVENGYKEIMLLGQNVNSYGKNLKDRTNFSALLKMLDNLGAEYRIRFMTSHPKDATRELIDTIASSKHICKNLHLPFQSGSDRILKAMNRGYTRRQYLDIIDYAKERIPDLSLTSDIIVGFPGETQEDFEQTVSLIKEVKFSSLFTFIYSKRPGTLAAKLEDDASHAQKAGRLSYLLDVQLGICMSIYQNMVGQVFKCLIESRANSENRLLARTDGNIIIEALGDDGLIGKFVQVKVTDIVKRTLQGEVL